VAASLSATAYATGGTYWFPTTFAVVSFVVVDTIPDLVLRPYVSGRTLHVRMVMLAYIVGPTCLTGEPRGEGTDTEA